MKQFQLSIFYHGYYLSYAISTDDDRTFYFALKSAPEVARYAPDHFATTRTTNGWMFDLDLNNDFKKEMAHVLKRANV